MASASAEATIFATDDGMSQLSGKTVMTIYHLAVDNDTTTHTGAQRNHDKVLHTASRAIGHFTDTGSIGVVCQSGRDTQALFKHGSQRNYTLPGKVRGKLNSTAVIVSVRSTNTDTFYLVYATVGNNERQQILANFVYVIIDVLISSGFDGTACNNSSACVYNTKDGVCSAYVNAHYIGLFHV